MQHRMTADKIFEKEYQEISDCCQRFVTQLLALCRDTDEVETLLCAEDPCSSVKQKKRLQKFLSDRSSGFYCCRLTYAMRYNQKEFVAHPHVQLFLQLIMWRHVPSWATGIRLVLCSFILVLASPVIFTLYSLRVPLVDPIVKPPAYRFLNDISSYFIFLALLFIGSATLIPLTYASATPSQLAIDVLLVIWTLGFFIRSAKTFARHRQSSRMRYHNYANASWWFADFLYPLFLCLFYLCRLVGFLRWQSTDYRHRPRHEWTSTDPYVFAEIMYSISMVLAVLRVSSYFKAISFLGPLQIALKNTPGVVLRFLILFALSALAFSVALTALYAGAARQLDDRAARQLRFNSFLSTLSILCWNIFGYGESSDADMSLQGENHRNASTGKLRMTAVVEPVGHAMYFIYQICVVTILINMLIAMMTNTYNCIERNSVTEWLFSRTRLYLTYLNEIDTTPPPYNIFPTRKLVGVLGKFLGLKQRKTPYIVGPRTPSNAEYQALMKHLQERYWNQRRLNGISSSTGSFCQHDSPSSFNKDDCPNFQFENKSNSTKSGSLPPDIPGKPSFPFEAEIPIGAKDEDPEICNRGSHEAILHTQRHTLPTASALAAASALTAASALAAPKTCCQHSLVNQDSEASKKTALESDKDSDENTLASDDKQSKNEPNHSSADNFDYESLA